MDQGTAVAASFSLELSRNRYVVVESEWGDTPEGGIDFHVMSAAVCPTPKNVTVGPGYGGYVTLQRPLSIVRLEHGLGLLSRISVYTRDESSEEEEVRYDVGLLFEYDDGRRFALTANESIAGGLRYTNKEEHLAALCADELRLVLE